MRTRWLLPIDRDITPIKSIFRTKILFSVGGLGNQLFIFNFAHKLIESGATKVVIFSNWHRGNRERSFQLEPIKSNCRHKISFSDSQFLYKACRILIRVVSVINFNFMLPKTLKIYIEGRVKSCNNFENYMIFSGYFQDTSFFPKNAFFLDEFGATVIDSYDKLSTSLQDQFLNSFQAIHIRRGDYISHSATFGILATDYFSKQLKEDLPLLVLSEENLNHAFVNNSKSLLQIPDSFTPWQLMSVLSKATFLAGSNSTFSFWPAFYIASQGREASIPTPWFKNHPEYRPNLNGHGLTSYPAVWE